MGRKTREARNRERERSRRTRDQAAVRTLYFVAVVWRHKSEQRLSLTSDAFAVAGRTPLSAEKAGEVGRANIAAAWKPEAGPVEDWEAVATNVINCEVG